MRFVSVLTGRTFGYPVAPSPLAGTGLRALPAGTYGVSDADALPAAAYGVPHRTLTNTSYDSLAYHVASADVANLKETSGPAVNDKPAPPTSTVTVRHGNADVRFSEADIVNPDDWIPRGESNPHNVRPFLLHDHGFTICVVFADCLQDALNLAVDADKLDRYLVTAATVGDYEGGWESEQLTHLGNASEPFDIESLDVLELPNPGRCLAAQFVASGYATWTHGGPDA